MEIIPAIMPDSFEDLQAKMREVSGWVSLVQIDVMDGVFVPSRSWPEPQDKDFEEIVQGRLDMPYLSALEFEVDLMVSTPEREAERWIRAGARRVIVHWGSSEDHLALINTVREGSVPTDSPLAVECGLAITPEVQEEEIEDLIPFLDFVQCMGIDQVGYQGQPFQPQVLSTISTLREKHPGLIISVDGGVNLETAAELVAVGADRLVAGSAIYESEDPERVIEAFKALLQKRKT